MNTVFVETQSRFLPSHESVLEGPSPAKAPSLLAEIDHVDVVFANTANRLRPRSSQPPLRSVAIC